jgi:hypothetical protein
MTPKTGLSFTCRPSSFSPVDLVLGLILSKFLTHLTQFFEQTSFFLIKSSTYGLKIVCQSSKKVDTWPDTKGQILTHDRWMVAAHSRRKKVLQSQKRSASLGTQGRAKKNEVPESNFRDWPRKHARAHARTHNWYQ